MNEQLHAALARVFADVAASGGPVPAVEDREWQDWPSAESALLWSEGGDGVGVWVDTSLPEPDRVAMVAAQAQEWLVEDLPRVHLPTNWPQCPEHPTTHPLEPAVLAGVAVWRCPRSLRPVAEIGHLGDPGAGLGG